MTDEKETNDPNDTRDLLRGLSAPPLPDPEAAWARVRRELDAPHRAPIGATMRVRPIFALAAGFALLVLGGTAGLLQQYVAPRAWSVVTQRGAPTVNGTALTGTGTLAQDEWLETDSTSLAQLAVGRIGTAAVGPQSRVQMVRDGLLAHRLVLERGEIDAIITAPPRLFFVETPAAVATDLGCAYTLTVQDDGSTRLFVTSGWVELAKDDRRVLVPEGLVSNVTTGGVPSTPYVPAMGAEGLAALQRIDAGTATDEDIRALLAALPTSDAPLVIRQRYGVTLWHLIPRLTGAQREHAVQALAVLSPPPDGVTTEGILRLDRRMLNRWRRDLIPMWGELAAPFWAKAGQRLWTWAMG